MIAPPAAFLLVLLLSTSSFSSPLLAPRKNESSSWDFLFLALQWPPGVCKTAPSFLYCETPNFLNFTLLGLRPMNNDTSSPTNCDPKDPFDYAQISSLAPELDVDWPSLYQIETTLEIWTEEWDQSGTCAKSDPHLDTQHKYFSQALSLFQEIHLLSKLASEGVKPSNGKQISSFDFNQALNQAMGVDAVLLCGSAGHTNMQYEYMVGVGLCLTPDLRFFECSPEVYGLSSCFEDFFFIV